MRNRRSSARIDGHQQTVSFAAADWRGYRETFMLNMARNHREVAANCAFVFDLLCKLAVYGVALCSYEQAGGVLVQAMHDAGPKCACCRAQFVFSCKQCVNKRGGVQRRGGMNG